MIDVKLNRWTIRQKQEFLAALAQDEQKAIDLLVKNKVVAEWSLEGDPATEDAWLTLDSETFGEAVGAVIKASRAMFREGFQRGTTGS